MLISADTPERNQKFRRKMDIPWPLLSDELHEISDRYGVPISRKHPKAISYEDGFIQPAVFVYRGEEEVFAFIQTPRLTNLWGAARRPEPEQVLEQVRARLGAS